MEPRDGAAAFGRLDHMLSASGVIQTQSEGCSKSLPAWYLFMRTR